MAIADGAAFGNEMEGLAGLQELRPRKVAIFLPESFEWIILKSGVVKLSDEERLLRPEEHADSTEYMSWEQYFTALLETETAATRYMRYEKSKLPDYYLQDDNAAKIRSQVEGIALEG